MKRNVLEWRKRLFLKANVNVKSHYKVLDVGCGDGGDCELFVQICKEVVGIDVEPHANWNKIETNKLKFLISDVCNLPFPDNTFDLVFEKDVLHHMTNHELALAEIKRVSKKNGQIILIEANRHNPVFYIHMTMMKGHQHFTRSFFTKLVTRSFTNPVLICAESRVYPEAAMPIIRLLHIAEDLLERIPLVRNYVCYNIAFMENRGSNND